MSTFVNLLDIVYPTGSIYCSTSSTSPATTFGGTWSQIKDAFLGGKGTDYITANLAAYGGNKAMTVNQMPSHTHNIAAFPNEGSDSSGRVMNVSAKDSWGHWLYNNKCVQGMIENNGGGKLRPLLLFSQYLETHGLTLKEGGRNVNLR